MTYSCPEGYSHKADYLALRCGSWNCNTSDTATCCESHPKCNEFVVSQEGYTLKGHAENITCLSTTCDQEDDFEASSHPGTPRQLRVRKGPDAP